MTEDAAEPGTPRPGALATDGGEADGADHIDPDDPVEHVSVRPGMSVGELVTAYADAGFGGGDVHDAASLLAECLDDDVTLVMGLAGAMVPAGMRRIVADLLRDGHVDALVTTGATLTHDAIEAIGGAHHHGEVPDPSERRDHDESLRAAGVDRIYDVHLPQEHFATFETHLRERVFPDLATEGTVPISELTAALGRANAAAHAERERAADDEGTDEGAPVEGAPTSDPGIAAAAAEADVPVFCPAVQDSVLGIQAWLYGQTSDLGLDALGDMTRLNDIANRDGPAAAFVVGGGVPKNYVLQTMLVAPEAYQYGIQLTMDPPRTGGLSGASLDEARSWGKLEPTAENVSVYADATITLPLVVTAALEYHDAGASVGD